MQPDVFWAGYTAEINLQEGYKKNWSRWKSGPQPKLTAYEKFKLFFFRYSFYL
jgi:hypothetical protein